MLADPPIRKPRFVRVEFAPSSGCLGSIIQVVNDFCRNIVDDQDICSAFRLAAYELLENGVKYSSGDRVIVHVEVESAPRCPNIVLSTENRAPPERLADVDQRLKAAELAADPVAHFDQLVREALASPGESRLGIGRLRAEGDMLLSHRISGETLWVNVRRPVRRTPREAIE